MFECELIAWISVVLYFSLGSLSFYNYHYFAYKLPGLGRGLLESSIGRFDDSKRIFFLVMTISAFLDMPLYAGCGLNHGPEDCEWDSLSYTFLFILHLFALCGYFVCLGIPLFLWTSLISRRENSPFLHFDTKLFLYISIVCYFLIQMVRVVTLFFDSRLSTTFQNNVILAVTSCLEPAFIVIISAIWLWCGLKLQMYVVRVCFRPDAERRILFAVNSVMFTVLICFLVRAILVLSLFLDFIGLDATDFMLSSYTAWIIGTRWMPYVFCSYLLIFIMKRSVESTPNHSKESIDKAADGVHIHASCRFSPDGLVAVDDFMRPQSVGSDENRSQESADSIYIADYDGGLYRPDFNGSTTSILSVMSQLAADDMNNPLLRSYR